jgi:ribosomal protein S8
MKWIFILLLLLNVIYFGWELDRQTNIEVKNSTVPFVISNDVKQLVLISELESSPALINQPIQESESDLENIDASNVTEQSVSFDQLTDDVMIEEEFSSNLVSNLPDISANGISQDKDSAEALCFSYGPFPANEQAENLKQWFEQKNILVNQRTENEQTKNLFWIYLAPQKSRESAIAAIEDLKSKGIKDYRLISSGDLRNAISLGLFSTQAIVNRRLNELKNKGYQPIVVPYHNAKVIYWVDVKLIAQQNLLNDLFTEYPSRFNSIPMNCSEIALL